MRDQLIAILLIASVCSAQTPMPAASGGANSAPQTLIPPSGSVTVAQGTSIPMTLVSSIKSKSTKPGDAVRAVVAFPVTVGTQLAIPAGTYVEGVVNDVKVRAPHTHMASVEIHFTRLLFANGYSAALDAANTEAMVTLPGKDPQPNFGAGYSLGGTPFLGEGFGVGGQTMPEPAPLPRIGPNPAVVVGATLGSVAVFLVLVLTLGHRQGSSDFVLFDNGWQFQMALSTPLTLDAGKVAAAAEMPASH
jgi:hypothetical protein